MIKEVDSEAIYNKKILKIKTKSYGDESTDFHDKEILKANHNCTCIAVTIICKYIFKRAQIHQKRKKVVSYFTDGLEVCCDDSDEQ